MAAFLVITVSVICLLQCQPVESFHRCVTDELFNDPVLKAAVDASNAAWNAIKAERTREKINAASSYPHLDLPVVIHILYDAANNPDGISPDESQQWYSYYVDILKQMHIDFNQEDPKVTPHTKWQDRVANMNITMFIDRIIYKDVGSNSPYPDFANNDLPDSSLIQSAETGDASIDPAHHLDIWFVYHENVESSFGAYAFEPSAQILGDGYLGMTVRMSYLTEYERRTTYTHEVGHWIGLGHIWGSDDPPSCTDDDGIDDTPNMAATYLGECPSTLAGNTCGADTPGDEPDMFDNLMSYALCRLFFTDGQLERSRTIGNDTHPIGILPSFFEYDEPAIGTDLEFLSFFYFVGKDEDCMFRDVKKEFCLKAKQPTYYKKGCNTALCLSYSQNPFVAVYEDLEVIVGDDSSCSPGFQRIDTILTSANAVDHSYVCYKKVEQSDPMTAWTLIDLDIKLSKGRFTLFMTTANGQVFLRSVPPSTRNVWV